MQQTIENKREHQRFDVNFPATMLNGFDSMQLATRDISAGGAFLTTSRPFDVGTKVRVEIILDNSTLFDMTGHKGCIKVTGTVVRCDADGIAVKFGDHKIMPHGGMMDN